MLEKKYSERSIGTTIFINAIVIMTFYCITNTFTSFFDGYIIGHYLGDDATSAIRLVKTLNQLMICIAQLFGLGCQIIATKYVAIGEKDKANKVFNMVFFFTMFLAIGLAILNLSISKWIPFALSGGKAKQEVMELCTTYIFGYSIGIPFLILNQILNPIVYLDGNHKISKITIGVSIIVDCTITFLVAKFAINKIFFIGLASSLSCFACFITYMTHFISKKYSFKLRFAKIQSQDFKDVLKQGSTMALKLLAITAKLYLFTIIIFNVGNNFSKGYGDVINAARGYQETISGFFETPLGGLLLTILMINGVYYSEQNDTQFKNLIKNVLKFYLIVCLSIAIVYFFSAKSIANIYLPKGSKSMDLCIFGMKCGAITILFLAFNTTVLAVFQSSRKVLRAYITTLVQSFILPVSCMAIFGFAMGPYGIFIGYLVNTMLFIPIYLIWTVIWNKGWPKSIKDFFMLEKEYGFKEKCKIDIDIHSDEDINNLNKKIIEFARKNKINRQTQYQLQICVFCLLNSVLNKYTKSKKHLIANVRITLKNNEIKCVLTDNAKIDILSEIPSKSKKLIENNMKLIKFCKAEYNNTNILKMNSSVVKINAINNWTKLSTKQLKKYLCKLI